MSSRIMSFVKGALVGLGVGLLVAPKSGRETRDDIVKKMDEMKKQGLDYADLATEKGKEYADLAAVRGTELTQTSKHKVNDVRRSLAESSKNLRET